MDLSRNNEAAADSRRRWRSGRTTPKRAFAVCIAELPVLYTDESRDRRRRAAYERKLRQLHTDVESGTMQGDLVKSLAAKLPFLLAYQGDNDRELQKLYGEMVAGSWRANIPPAPLPPPPAAGEPIRVGIVSASSAAIPTGRFRSRAGSASWIAVASRCPAITSAHPRCARPTPPPAMCDRFVHRPLTIDGWRREILADAPHVLIYPGLLMDTYSLQLAAQRLAAVQCNSWGHPETSGMPTLDYFLSQRSDGAAGRAGHYTEKLVRLPNLSIYYEPVDKRAGLGDPRGTGLASRCNGVLERAVGLQIPSAIRSRVRAHRARGRQLPVRVLAP